MSGVVEAYPTPTFSIYHKKLVEKTMGVPPGTTPDVFQIREDLSSE